MASADRRGLSKQTGDAIEAAVIEECRLEHVPDSEATWHDAVTTERTGLAPDVEIVGAGTIDPETPVDVKGAIVERSNGDRDSPGHWYIKQTAHEQLVAADGYYLLVVYVPRSEPLQLARLAISASDIDADLRERWYTYDGDDRSEDIVAQLSWTALLDPADLEGGGA